MKSIEFVLPPLLSEALCAFAARESLESLEARALDPKQRKFLLSELDSPAWRFMIKKIARIWSAYDHAIIRGLPIVGEGTTTLLLALVLGSEFKSYRSDKIVKYFKTSPWTTELSQSLREGDFHTDLSTSLSPPRVTLIHCREPDPTPGCGILRIVRVPDLLAELRRKGADKALELLLTDTVEMVDERAEGAWSGIMASESTIRFHPATLKAASRRGFEFSNNLEQQLSVIREAALAKSAPIELQSGDALLVSNSRALHYRGECTVQYSDFPRHFKTREIHVLHLHDEPTWQEKNLKT